MSHADLPRVTLLPLFNQLVPVVEGFIGEPGKTYAIPPKYTYKVFLARGASGNTFEATRNADNKAFAIKVICLDRLSPAERLRQESEVACMSSVSHFACVRLLESVITDRVLFLVMEYCDGGDLSYQIRSMRAQRAHAQEARGADNSFAVPAAVPGTGGGLAEGGSVQCAGFDEDNLKYIVLQLVLGLHHMHTHCHMLHRDLKPRNVLTTTSGLLKIGDFGFSKSYDTMKDDVANTFCGTPYYIAPEVWQKRPYGRPADMWSLGIMLYECMTTAVPFISANIEQLRAKILKDAPRPVTVGSYSAELRNIVRSLLNKDPSARPDTRALLQTPYLREALSTFDRAIPYCPTVADVMAQARAALEPAPVYHPNNAVEFESGVSKLRTTTGEWVSRHLVLQNGELRLERPRRRPGSDYPLGTGSATQSGRRSTDSSRNSTFSNLVLPHTGLPSPTLDVVLPPSSASPHLNSTISNDSNFGSPMHHPDDGLGFTRSPVTTPQPELVAHGLRHAHVMSSPVAMITSPPPSTAARQDLSCIKVTSIEDLQLLNDTSLTLRLVNNQFIFFETPHAAAWEQAIRECLGWPAALTGTS